jgi:hypothetical protein
METYAEAMLVDDEVCRSRFPRRVYWCLYCACGSRRVRSAGISVGGRSEHDIDIRRVHRFTACCIRVNIAEDLINRAFVLYPRMIYTAKFRSVITQVIVQPRDRNGG